ncbi:hypothetical protein DdX_06290 [Ditylenchus destructor]|uniref:Uncharacterized protein n=1 Tax=Ditylenchus destructor TaxID=166010 RepID=A0AAD4N701_9BILA|nr:hypothetical protein DdX_06290 [Ditylenchus destructor]
MKRRQKPFSIQQEYMKKPKPWKKLTSRLHSLAESSRNISKSNRFKESLLSIVRRVKCATASNALLKCNPFTWNQSSKMYLKYNDSWEKRNKQKRNSIGVTEFPFLRRNLETCVNTWHEYEEKLQDWAHYHRSNPVSHHYTKFKLKTERMDGAKNHPVGTGYYRRGYDVDNDIDNDLSVPSSFSLPTKSGTSNAYRNKAVESRKSSTFEARRTSMDTSAGRSSGVSNKSVSNMKKQLLKSFYTVYHIQKLYGGKKGSKEKVFSSVDELANSKIVEKSVEKPPRGGLRDKQYSPEEAAKLTQKTLIALERWRNSQGPVFLPDGKRAKRTRINSGRQFHNCADSESEEEPETGLDTWNRHVEQIENGEMHSTATHESLFNNDASFSHLSFESIQSMPAGIQSGRHSTNSHHDGPIITEVLSTDDEGDDSDNYMSCSETGGDQMFEHRRNSDNNRSNAQLNAQGKMANKFLSDQRMHPKVSHILKNAKAEHNVKRNSCNARICTSNADDKENQNEMTPLTKLTASLAQRTLESNLKAISTPALFGRLEKGSNNSHKNATLGSGPDNCCRARLFANSPSEMIKALNRQSVQSKARTTPAISPAYFTEQTIPLRRSPRLSHQ